MKTCTKCEAELEDGQFNWRDKKLQKRHRICKVCVSRLSETAYETHRDTRLSRIKDRQHALRSLVDDLKRVPCVDCGFCWNPWQMDFDHRDPATKVADISKLVSTGNKDAVLAEIEKCDPVCSNCHRNRTHERTV